MSRVGIRRGSAAIAGLPSRGSNRQERIYELQNRLAAQHLDPADELSVREQLDALANPELPEDEQAARWARVQRLAPGVVAAGGRLIEGLASAAIRQQLGL